MYCIYYNGQNLLICIVSEDFVDYRYISRRSNLQVWMSVHAVYTLLGDSGMQIFNATLWVVPIDNTFVTNKSGDTKLPNL